MDRRPEGKERAEITKALQEKLGQDKVRAPRNKPEATVHIKDIEAVATEIEVKAAIQKAVGEEAIHIASLREGFAGTLNATVYLSKAAEEKLLKLRTIRIGMPSCRVVANKQVQTCFKCWMPGHTARSCQGPDRTKACRNCGKEGHLRKECKEPSSCAVCGEKGHPANTTRCPTFRKALDGAKSRPKKQGPAQTQKPKIPKPKTAGKGGTSPRHPRLRTCPPPSRRQHKQHNNAR